MYTKSLYGPWWNTVIICLPQAGITGMCHTASSVFILTESSLYLIPCIWTFAVTSWQSPSCWSSLCLSIHKRTHLNIIFCKGSSCQIHHGWHRSHSDSVRFPKELHDGTNYSCCFFSLSLYPFVLCLLWGRLWVKWWPSATSSCPEPSQQLQARWEWGLSRRSAASIILWVLSCGPNDMYHYTPPRINSSAARVPRLGFNRPRLAADSVSQLKLWSEQHFYWTH